VLNALTIDVEGFVEANLESFSVPESHRDAMVQDAEIEANVQACLEVLAELGTRATFFFLGRIARDLPMLVREVVAAGHEIGCHGDEHRRIFGLTPEEFARGLRDAKVRLEDLTGVTVLGFRAPDFSITRASLWALDILREAGFAYDSSIYPIGGHDVYGIPSARPYLHRMEGGLIEFPMPSVKILGWRLPFGGGGWFRLYPVALTRLLIRNANALGEPCMFYIHPYEVGPRMPEIPGMSPVRRFRHYHNTSPGRARLLAALRGFRFDTAATVLRERGFLKES
jgi:polysaccharide deacetylase family protein (PEP-CTERM system associated)